MRVTSSFLLATACCGEILLKDYRTAIKIQAVVKIGKTLVGILCSKLFLMSDKETVQCNIVEISAIAA